MKELLRLIYLDALNTVIVIKRKGIKRLLAIIYVFLFYANFKPVRNFRIYSYLVKKGHIFKLIGYLIYERTKRKYNVEIQPFASIGPGFYIAHLGSIVIGNHAKLGNNVIVLNSVNIGEKKGFGMPEIGDNVYVGAGAKILGNIKIGNNCIIGANSVVIDSFPNDSIIPGIPAKIIKKV